MRRQSHSSVNVKVHSLKNLVIVMKKFEPDSISNLIHRKAIKLLNELENSDIEFLYCVTHDKIVIIHEGDLLITDQLLINDLLLIVCSYDHVILPRISEWEGAETDCPCCIEPYQCEFCHSHRNVRVKMHYEQGSPDGYEAICSLHRGQTLVSSCDCDLINLKWLLEMRLDPSLQSSKPFDKDVSE